MKTGPKPVDIETRVLLKIHFSDGCWEWMGAPASHGYGTILVGEKRRLAHRVVFELFVGPIPPGMNVLHSCDNRRCVNWEEDLFLGTLQDNTQDMMRKGRNKFIIPDLRGARNGSCKLSLEQVWDIRHDPRPYPVIAATHNISRTQISRIKLGRKWGWLTAA